MADVEAVAMTVTVPTILLVLPIVALVMAVWVYAVSTVMGRIERRVFRWYAERLARRNGFRVEWVDGRPVFCDPADQAAE